MHNKHSRFKQVQDFGSSMVNRGREGVDYMRGRFNELGMTNDEALLLGLGVGGGLMAPTVAGLVDMGTGEQTGFGEAPRNVAGAALGVVGGGTVAGGIPALAAKMGGNRIQPQVARQALRGGAVGALMGGFSSGAIMVSNDRPTPAPGDQRSIAASLNMKDLSELNALLDANRAY